jgi:hypothetical protein
MERFSSSPSTISTSKTPEINKRRILDGKEVSQGDPSHPRVTRAEQNLLGVFTEKDTKSDQAAVHGFLSTPGGTSDVPFPFLRLVAEYSGHQALPVTATHDELVQQEFKPCIVDEVDLSGMQLSALTAGTSVYVARNDGTIAKAVVTETRKETTIPVYGLGQTTSKIGVVFLSSDKNENILAHSEVCNETVPVDGSGVIYMPKRSSNFHGCNLSREKIAQLQRGDSLALCRATAVGGMEKATSGSSLEFAEVMSNDENGVRVKTSSGKEVVFQNRNNTQHGSEGLNHDFYYAIPTELGIRSAPSVITSSSGQPSSTSSTQSSAAPPRSTQGKGILGRVKRFLNRGTPVHDNKAPSSDLAK